MPKIILTAAMTRNTRVIGVGGVLPWRLPSDLLRFKRLTDGGTVIVRWGTFSEILQRNRGPLKNRDQIVLTNSHATQVHAVGCTPVKNFRDALEAAYPAEEVFVIGGQGLYEETIHQADRLYVTLVNADIKGDKHFPVIDPLEWRVNKDESSPEMFFRDPGDDHKTAWMVYDRYQQAKGGEDRWATYKSYYET